jgi:hypothetical protein
MAVATYGSRSVRRPRRTKAEIDNVRAHLYDVLDGSESAMTVRQVFYQMVSRGLPKTENEYKNTVVRLLTEMRLNGIIPFGWIADNTRWMRKPTTFSDLEAALQNTAQTYRRQLWANQDAYVEVWLEKEALAGVVVDITADFDVPLMVTRGYPSVSFLHEAAEAIDAHAFGPLEGTPEEQATALGQRLIFGSAKDVYIYYFGDHDPSGIDIPRNVEDRLEEFASAYIEFTCVAVTEEQIEAFGLPTRPTKRTDSRAKNWQGARSSWTPSPSKSSVTSCAPASRTTSTRTSWPSFRPSRSRNATCSNA